MVEVKYTCTSKKYMQHSFKFICLTRKEETFLFHDALNTCYFRLYGVGHTVKDHSDNEKGNMGYTFRLAARIFHMYHPTDWIAHTTAC